MVPAPPTFSLLSCCSYFHHPSLSLSLYPSSQLSALPLISPFHFSSSFLLCNLFFAAFLFHSLLLSFFLNPSPLSLIVCFLFLILTFLHFQSLLFYLLGELILLVPSFLPPYSLLSSFLHLFLIPPTHSSLSHSRFPHFFIHLTIPTTCSPFFASPCTGITKRVGERRVGVMRGGDKPHTVFTRAVMKKKSELCRLNFRLREKI